MINVNWGYHLIALSIISKEIKPVYPKGNQPWIFIERIDAETEAPILWPPDATNWLIGKDPDAAKDWRQEEKGMTEDEMLVWHHMSLSKLQELVMDWRGKPVMLQSMGSQRDRHDWAAEWNEIELEDYYYFWR